MPDHDPSMRTPDAAVRLSLLLDQALNDRRRRLYVRDVRAHALDEFAMRRARAAHLVERMLSSCSPAIRDCSPYLLRLFGRLQLASETIGSLSTRIDPMRMDGERARGLALAIADIVRFLEACALPDTTLDLRVVFGRGTTGPMLAIAAWGEVTAVAPASATRVYDRAREIIQLLRGTVEREVHDGGMTIGVRLPPCR